MNIRDTEDGNAWVKKKLAKMPAISTFVICVFDGYSTVANTE